MSGNKRAYIRRVLVRGLLVMVVMFMMMTGCESAQYSVSYANRPLQAASAEAVSIKNNPPAAMKQDLPPAVESASAAVPAVKASVPVRLSGIAPARTDLKRAQKTVYITFDDGPSAVTPKVLNILRREGVRATFFVLGNAAKSHPELINDIWEQGHAIGNHTYNHNYHALYSGFTEFWKQIKQTEEIVRNITGVRPQLIRAPGGTFGHFDDTYFQLLKQAGYLVTDWTADSGDSKRKGVPASEILKKSTADMKASEVVLLLHDGSGHEQSAKALPKIIAKYKAAGYAFDVLDGKVKPVQFRVSSKGAGLARTKPSAGWIASNITPNAGLFAPGKPLFLEVGKLETKLAPGEYAIHEDHYIVPLRAGIERLGGQVSWDAAKRSGRIVWNGKEVTADVLNKRLILSGPDGDVQEARDTSIQMIGGSIWVPLRELLEIAGHPPLAVGVSGTERRVTAL